jgi:hypothetical protein
MKRDKLAQRISGFILRVQHGFAREMEKIFSRLAVKKMKILVLFFSVLTSGLSLYFIVEALLIPAKKINTVKPDAIYVPLLAETENMQANQNSLLLDEETWNSIKNFKDYMDSLSAHAPRKYNNIIQKRAGLMDSIIALEQMYYSTK